MNDLVDASFNLFQGCAVPFGYLLLIALTEEVQLPKSGMGSKEDDAENLIKRAGNVISLLGGNVAAPPFHKNGEIAIEMLDEQAYLAL